MSFLNREVFWKPVKYELIPWLEDIARVTGLPPDFHAGSVAQFSPLSYLVASGMTNYGPWSLSNRRLELSMLATTDMGWDFCVTCSVIRDEWSDRHIFNNNWWKRLSFFRLVHHWIFQFEELLGKWGGVILFVIMKLWNTFDKHAHEEYDGKKHSDTSQLVIFFIPTTMKTWPPYGASNGEANQRWTRSPLFNGEIKPEDPTVLNTFRQWFVRAVCQKTSGVIGKCVYIAVLVHVYIYIYIYLHILIISCWILGVRRCSLRLIDNERIDIHWTFQKIADGWWGWEA